PMPLHLAIEGQATNEGKEIRRRAEQHLFLSREASPAASMLTLSHFAVGLSATEPFAVRGPAEFEVVKGYPARGPVTVSRGKGQEALVVEVTGALSPPVPGQPPAPALLTFKPATAAAGAGSTEFTLTPAANAPEGQMFDLLVRGKAKVGAADRT